MEKESHPRWSVSGARMSTVGQGSGLNWEEQAGELATSAVSVHQGQGLLSVVFHHGAHRGEELVGNSSEVPASGWEKLPEGAVTHDCSSLCISFEPEHVAQPLAWSSRAPCPSSQCSLHTRSPLHQVPPEQ